MDSDVPKNNNLQENIENELIRQQLEEFEVIEIIHQEKQEEDKPVVRKKETKKLSKEEKQKLARKKDKFFVLRMFIMTLCLSVVFSLVTEIVLSNGNIALSMSILILLIGVSIIFDAIGTAAASCDIQPYISKASRKDKTGIIAMNLLKNAESVASFCNDVVGDICGIVSGGCASTIVLAIALQTPTQNVLLSVGFSAVVSALTVGGKAAGKLLAIRGSEKIITSVAKVIGVFKK